MKDVLILGGGYVGVHAARRISRSAGGDQTRITLVSAAPCHAFHGWTAEVITGHVAYEHTRVPLEQLLPGVRIVHASVARIDAATRSVDVISPSGTERLRYDQLLIGVGSRDASDRVPGLAEHGWSLKRQHRGLGDLDDHLRTIVASAAHSTDPDETQRLLTVVVAGGGFTGTEAAAAIMQRLRAAVAAEPVLAHTEPRVHLLHSGEHLVPSLRPRFTGVADYLTEQVHAEGIDVRPGMRLASVSERAATLDDGSVIPAATVISTIGQTPVALPGTEAFARDGAGRMITARTLQVSPNVWAAGDVAAVPHPSGSGHCPANALWAIYQGKHAGRNIVRALHGRKPTAFRFPGLGQAASVGVGRGAAELYGVALTGQIAWVTRWAFFHAYMPSRRVAISTATDWWSDARPRPATRARQRRATRAVASSGVTPGAR